MYVWALLFTRKCRDITICLLGSAHLYSKLMFTTLSVCVWGLCGRVRERWGRAIVCIECRYTFCHPLSLARFLIIYESLGVLTLFLPMGIVDKSPGIDLHAC